MNFIKKISNSLLCFLLGIIVTSGIGITIAYNINANQISYEDINVSQAINNLYTMAESHCPDGKTCLTENKLGTSKVTVLPTTYKAIVYLDPTDLSKECNASNSRSETGTKDGCMKWYAYKDNGDSYDLILDHNTIARLSDCSNDCWQVAQNLVKEDTKNSKWLDSLNARNISVQDIWEITKDTNNAPTWTLTSSSFYFNGKNGNNGIGYGWLFERTACTSASGCEFSDNVSSYWTSDQKNSTAGWCVDNTGNIWGGAFTDRFRGIRPVITIQK